MIQVEKEMKIISSKYIIDLGIKKTKQDSWLEKHLNFMTTYREIDSMIYERPLKKKKNSVS